MVCGLDAAFEGVLNLPTPLFSFTPVAFYLQRRRTLPVTWIGQHCQRCLVRFVHRLFSEKVSPSLKCAPNISIYPCNVFIQSTTPFHHRRPNSVYRSLSLSLKYCLLAAIFLNIYEAAVSLHWKYFFAMTDSFLGHSNPRAKHLVGFQSEQPLLCFSTSSLKCGAMYPSRRSGIFQF